MFVNELGRNEQNSYNRSSIDASYQASFIWPSAFRGENRESIRDAIAELQVKIIWSNWIPVFKIYQCYVPSIVGSQEEDF